MSFNIFHFIIYVNMLALVHISYMLYYMLIKIKVYNYSI